MTRIDRTVNNTAMGVVGVVLMLGLLLAMCYRLA
jgi:hypothetical protein